MYFFSIYLFLKERVSRRAAERQGNRGPEVGSMFGHLGGSVGHPASAQVMILRFVGLSPVLGSVLTVQSLEPVSDSLSPSLSLPLPCSHSVSLSLSKINKHYQKKVIEVGSTLTAEPDARLELTNCEIMT